MEIYYFFSLKKAIYTFPTSMKLPLTIRTSMTVLQGRILPNTEARQSERSFLLMCAKACYDNKRTHLCHYKLRTPIISSCYHNTRANDYGIHFCHGGYIVFLAGQASRCDARCRIEIRSYAETDTGWGPKNLVSTRRSQCEPLLMHCPGRRASP